MARFPPLLKSVYFSFRNDGETAQCDEKYVAVRILAAVFIALAEMVSQLTATWEAKSAVHIVGADTCESLVRGDNATVCRSSETVQRTARLGQSRPSVASF